MQSLAAKSSALTALLKVEGTVAVAFQHHFSTVGQTDQATDDEALAGRKNLVDAYRGIITQSGLEEFRVRLVEQ